MTSHTGVRRVAPLTFETIVRDDSSDLVSSNDVLVIASGQCKSNASAVYRSWASPTRGIGPRTASMEEGEATKPSDPGRLAAILTVASLPPWTESRFACSGCGNEAASVCLHRRDRPRAWVAVVRCKACTIHRMIDETMAEELADAIAAGDPAWLRLASDGDLAPFFCTRCAKAYYPAGGRNDGIYVIVSLRDAEPAGADTLWVDVGYEPHWQPDEARALEPVAVILRLGEAQWRVDVPQPLPPPLRMKRLRPHDFMGEPCTALITTPTSSLQC